MKKGAAALIMIFFLALGFAAWGAYSLNDDALSLTITSEPLLGGSALEDFPVTERSQLATRVLFTADSAGESSVEWLRESESFYSREPVLTLGSYSPYYGVTFSASGSGSSPEELLDAGGEHEYYLSWDNPKNSIIAYASERAEPIWGEQTLRISLGDFTGGYLPVGAVLHSGDGVDVSEYFPIPLPEGAAADVRITLTPPGPENGYSGSVSYDIEPALGAQYLSAVGGAADAGEWSYFLFYAYEADTDGDFVRRLDGSMLPGGGWGVWRVPCEGEGEERSPDFARAELVVPMDWGWEGACLGLSDDGGELLVFTTEGRELWLNAYSLEGEPGSRVRLSDGWEYYNIDGLEVLTGPDCAGIDFVGAFCAAVKSGGEWRAAAALELDALPDGGEEYAAWYDEPEITSRSGRLALLGEGRLLLPGEDRSNRIRRLCVFEDGSLTSCELIRSQLDGVHKRIVDETVFSE